MSSLAASVTSEPQPEPFALKVVRYLDLVVLALALPIFLAAGFPMLGYIAGGGIWLIQRGIQAWSTHKATSTDDVRATVGILTGSMIGRGWLVAGTILAVGLSANDRVGLSAAVLVVVLFTVYFTAQMIIRPFQNDPRP